jgi:heme-degrading monooxygenase HmoA
MAKGLLLVAFDFTNAHEDEFHDWYDLEHIPERQRVPGFGLCERWISVTNPKQAIASYDLASLSVLTSGPYLAIAHENLSPWSKRVGPMCTRLIRFDGEQTLPGDADSPAGAGGLLVNAINVTPEHEAEFNEWYDHEHIPALAAVPGVLSARRFRDPKGTHRYLALYHLQSPEVPTRAAWKTAASSEWTERLRPHFRNHLRILARRYVRGG